jgi:glycine/D-amino acid oxidase-like deaminating enzyme
MATNKYKLAIIGGGSVGLSCAAFLALVADILEYLITWFEEQYIHFSY